MKGHVVGVIPILKKKRHFYLVLVTTRTKPVWIFPKGQVEKKLSDRKVAILEAFEEAGVKGNIVAAPYVCKVRGKKQKNYFMLVDEILESWPEEKERKRQIVRMKKGKKILKDKGHRKILNQIKQMRVNGDL